VARALLSHNVLYKGLRRALGEQSAHPGAYRTLDGYEHVSGVEMVDQTPIGRSPRSNPVTYIQVFDQIPHLFAPHKPRGYGATHPERFRSTFRAADARNARGTASSRWRCSSSPICS